MATTSPPDTAALAEHLRIAVARTARRLRQEAGTGLGPTLTAALATVERHGPLTPSELATRERIQRPTATRLVARLEEHGLLTRATDPQDGRSCVLTLTEAGHEHLAEVRTRKDAFLARHLEDLPAADRATLARAADLLEALLLDGGTDLA